MNSCVNPYAQQAMQTTDQICGAAYLLTYLRHHLVHPSQALQPLLVLQPPHLRRRDGGLAGVPPDDVRVQRNTQVRALGEGWGIFGSLSDLCLGKAWFGPVQGFVKQEALTAHQGIMHVMTEIARFRIGSQSLDTEARR